MFGSTSQIPQLPTLSNPNHDATAMFDFSTLDPNFMSLVNSFDNTFSQPAPQTQSIPQTFQTTAQAGPSVSQPEVNQQQSSFAATVTDDTDISTGFTPYLNADYTPPPSDPSPSTSTGYPLSREDLSAPTPNRHFENLSEMVANNARVTQEPPTPAIGEPTWNTGTGPSPSHPLSLKNLPGPGITGVDIALSQVLGEKSPEDPSAYANQSSTSYDTFQKPADSRAGPGAALGQEGYELVGGWFDANDLPRVARDHLYVYHPPCQDSR